MANKRVLISICTALSIIYLCTGCFKKQEPTNIEETTPVNNVVQKKVIIPKAHENKIDLYSSTPYDLPLISIIEISNLPQNLKKIIDNILENSQGFYYLKKTNDRVFIILQNPISITNTYSRHNLQFAEIDINGRVLYHSAGYNGIDGETSNAIEQKDGVWEFDTSIEPARPLKHTAFDENGAIKFVEYWNYSNDEPIKYQMKDANNKLLSILKESQDGDSNLRREHIFYDNEGTTKMSLCVNYEGANISRLNFYNSHESIESISIINNYEAGLKTKELIYDEQYTLKYTVTSEYQNGERKSIKSYDSEGNELNKISS